MISTDTSRNILTFAPVSGPFSSWSQVAGRTGRGEKTGRVIFQTYNQMIQ